MSDAVVEPGVQITLGIAQVPPMQLTVQPAPVVGIVLQQVEQPTLNVAAIQPAQLQVIAPGAQSTPATPEEEMVYSKRTDFVSDSLIYRAEAAPGTLDTAPSWRIRQLSIGIDGDVVEKLANGSASFNNAWSDRAALNYS